MLNYVAAKQQILEYIKQNKLKAGIKLPSEMEFSQMLGVSRLTLREAMNALKSEGKIYAVQGKGTFISFETDNIENLLNSNMSVTEMIKVNGFQPGVSNFYKELVKADKHIAEGLGIQEGIDVLMCSRVRLADGVPVALTQDYLSAKVAQRFLGNMDEKVSLYEFIEKECEVTLGTCRTEMMPISADIKLSDALEIKLGTLLMGFRVALKDVYGEALVYAVEYFRTDKFKFVVMRRRK